MNYIQKHNNERGGLTLYVLFIMLGVMLLSGLFINVTVTYLNVNFAKKALDGATLSRAQAVDVPLKESIGVVEVIHYPHTGSNGLYSASDRQLTDELGNVIPCNGFGQCGTTPDTVSSEYLDAVKYADTYAKNNMITAINSYTGKGAGGKYSLVQMKPENICFDVEPLPKDDGTAVTFACALKSNSGKVYTVEKTVQLDGYQDIQKNNHYTDDSLSGNNTKVQVNNVVFGAAVLEPKPLFAYSLYNLGYRSDKTRTFIYSIAYPQIDKCYGNFC